jgi:hypothetical protein
MNDKRELFDQAVILFPSDVEVAGISHFLWRSGFVVAQTWEAREQGRRSLRSLGRRAFSARTTLPLVAKTQSFTDFVAQSILFGVRSTRSFAS